MEYKSLRTNHCAALQRGILLLWSSMQSVSGFQIYKRQNPQLGMWRSQQWTCVGLHIGMSCIRKMDNSSFIWKCWEVWQFVQQGHRGVTEVTFWEIDCRGSCGAVHLVSHSPFLCLKQTGCDSFQVFAVNFCWLCRGFCHCSDGKANIWATRCAGTEWFTK